MKTNTTPWTEKQVSAHEWALARQRQPEASALGLILWGLTLGGYRPRPPTPTWEFMQVHGKVLVWPTREQAGDVLDTLKAGHILEPGDEFGSSGPGIESL